MNTQSLRPGGTPNTMLGVYVMGAGDSWCPVLNENSSALFRAVVEDDVRVVESELEHNPSALQMAFDIAYESPSGSAAASRTKSRTLLMIAAFHASLRVTSCLLSRGADVHAICDGLSAVEAARVGQRASGNVNSPIALAMLLDASEPRGHAVDPVVAAPCTPRAYENSSGAPGQLPAGASYVAGPFDLLGGVGRHKELECDSFHPEGLSYSTSELTRPEYSTDNFRLFCFKALRCSKRYAHDWRACPFAHPTENARRRDPREHRYCAVACPDYKQGFCARGDACCFSHGVFESWLHPSRYRTQLCKDGLNCNRPVCFFAHSLQELRTPTFTWMPGPEDLQPAQAAPLASMLLGGARQPGTPGQAGSGAAGGSSYGSKGAVPGTSAMAWQGPQGASGMPPPGARRSMDQSSNASVQSYRGDVSLSSSPGAAASVQRMIESGPLYSQRPYGSARSDQSTASSVSCPSPPAEGQRGAAPPGSSPGSGPLQFTPPRMSNEFARRHGLNPRDNAVLNLQKIALQAQVLATQQEQQPQQLARGMPPASASGNAFGPGMGSAAGAPSNMPLPYEAVPSMQAVQQQMQMLQQQLLQQQQQQMMMMQWASLMPPGMANGPAYSALPQQRDQFQLQDQQQPLQQPFSQPLQQPFSQPMQLPFSQPMQSALPMSGIPMGALPFGQLQAPFPPEALDLAMLHQQLAALSVVREQGGGGSSSSAMKQPAARGQQGMDIVPRFA